MHQLLIILSAFVDLLNLIPIAKEKAFSLGPRNTAVISDTPKNYVNFIVYRYLCISKWHLYAMPTIFQGFQASPWKAFPHSGRTLPAADWRGGYSRHHSPYCLPTEGSRPAFHILGQFKACLSGFRRGSLCQPAASVGQQSEENVGETVSYLPVLCSDADPDSYCNF